MMWKSLVRDGQGRPKCFIAIVEDITERKQAEAALKESEQRFRVIADSAPVMIWVSGLDKRCTFFNQGWLSFTGRTMEQELGEGWATGVHPDDLESCLQIYVSSFDAQRDFQMEYRLRRADGEYRWILDFGIPRFANGGTFVGYMGSCIDITERRRVQEEALDRSKLESLGVLTSGIAHYFNNLLGGILASAELLSAERTDCSRPEEEELTRIKADALRGGEIVRQLMIYSGEESHAFEPVVISVLIHEMLPLLRLSITKGVTLRIDIPGGIPPIHANSAQMRQVFMNLVTNASEAISDKAGVITIAAEHRRCAPDCSGADAMQSEHIRLSVCDDGCGMSADIRARIFDPFFTTKFAGRGLGLAIVLRIIRNHGGTINVMSEPGQGSSFEINLPCMNVR
jgi:PAS domain S-box-containing protein